jgi:hypothetical protein
VSAGRDEGSEPAGEKVTPTDVERFLAEKEMESAGAGDCVERNLMKSGQLVSGTLGDEPNNELNNNNNEYDKVNNKQNKDNAEVEVACSETDDISCECADKSEPELRPTDTGKLKCCAVCGSTETLQRCSQHTIVPENVKSNITLIIHNIVHGLWICRSLRPKRFTRGLL